MENTSPDVRQDSLHAWLLASRPKTLSGAAVPVMIGLSLAYADSVFYVPGTFKWLPAILCLVFALLMQIDANFINDFFDFVRGNDDAETRLGPLRACTQGWVKPESMKYAIAFTTILACIIGLPLVVYGGLEMILVGLICVVFCFLYTTTLSYIGLGDVLVLVFFGIIPVCVPYYIELHTVTWQVFFASVACGLVIDALLIVNNYRDRDNDSRDGKNTLVVIIGAQASEWLYLAVGVAAFICGISFWPYGSHPLAALLPVVYLVLHVFTWLKMKHINHGRTINICLGETARNILVYGIAVSLGIILI